MPNPDKRYRCDPKRAVEIFGDFTDELASSAIREIFRLRAESNDPITVLINSDGGSTRVLRIIDGALNTQDQDGRVPYIITVAAGNAFSAAASLLAFGDYAVAYQHSSIYFHGARYAEYTVTAEKAADINLSLKRSNFETAGQLADKVFSRLLHRYIFSEKEFKRKRPNVPDAPMLALERFVAHIKQKVSRRVAVLLETTLDQVRGARHFMGVVLPAVKLGKRYSPIGTDAKLLQELVKYEIKVKGRDNWRLDDEGRAKLMSDYSLLWEYLFGRHRLVLDKLVSVNGSSLLTTAQFNRFKKFPKEDKKRQAYLDKHARPKMIPFWFFAVKLTQHLLLGENELSANEAYWIGAIDEVIGRAELYGWRKVFEKDEPVTHPGPTAPAAPVTSPGATNVQSPPSSPIPNAPPPTS